MQQKAILLFDPDRRPEQMAFAAARTTILHQHGNNAWVEIDAAQADRLAAAGILVQFHPEANWIQTPAIVFDPLPAEPQPPPDLAAVMPSGPATAYAIVQFIAPPEESWISDIQALGCLFVQVLPANALVVRADQPSLSAMAGLSYVRWAGLWHPAYALAFTLGGRSESFSSAGLGSLQVAVPPAGSDLALALFFFADLLPGDRRSAVEAAGAIVRGETESSLIVDIAADKVRGLLRVDGIAVIEPHLPTKSADFHALAITQVNHVAQFRNPGFLTALDGSGEIVGIIDTGLDNGVAASVHPDLAGRVLLLGNLNGAAPAFSAADGQPDPSAPGARNLHGTHVTGIVAGNGSQSNGKVRGVAPGASVVMQSHIDLSVGGPANGINTNRFLDSNVGFALAHQRGARVHSNSWGSNSVGNQYLIGRSDGIDRFCYLNPEDLVLFAAGNNERDIAPADGVLDQGSLKNEGLAKNALTVGASENIAKEGIALAYNVLPLPGVVLPASGRFGLVAGVNAGSTNHSMSDNADHMAMFSDRGLVQSPAPVGGGAPPAPRRVKPDLVAPGTNILSTGPIIPAPGSILPLPETSPARPAGVSANFYYVDSGTSMAAPQVAGAALLVRQYYRQVYGQLRRPQLLEQIAQPIDRPAIAEHADGAVLAWVRHEGGRNHLVAARCDRTLTRQGNIVQLVTDVSDKPVPMLARTGERTLLLHRGADRKLRLSCFDAALQPVNTYGTNGVATVPTTGSDESEHRPALCVHGNEVALVWRQDGGENLLFQRFTADTGAAIDAGPIALGPASATSSHPYVLHNGVRYAVVWMRQDGDAYKVQMRFVSNAGAALGAAPLSVFQQNHPIQAPHFDWEGTRDQYLVAWVDERAGAPRSIFATLTDQEGAATGAPVALATVADPSVVKNVFVARHPTAGFLALWEDNQQRGESVFNPTPQTPRFDVNLLFLDANGRLDGRIAGGRTRISDASRDTYGFACLVNWDAITPIWLSNDELNADLIGVYALQVTLEGRYQAQMDPNTPLIDSGNYTRHQLTDHADPLRTALAMVWAGGDLYMLRTMPNHDPLGAGAQLDLLRVNADGLPDAGFGYSGARQVDTDFSYRNVALHWAGQRLVAASGQSTTTRLLLFDLTANAAPVATFGFNGVREIAELATGTINAQVSHQGVGGAFRVIAAWGRRGPTVPAPVSNHLIRYGVLDEQGAFTVAARDLVTGVAGTALHGWFHFVESETPSRSIAAWHSVQAGNMAVFVNRFQPDGSAERAAPPPAAYAPRPPLQLTTLAGDSQNAVIAPRPQAPAPTGGGTAPHELLRWRQRQYGVAWQYRPNAGTPWAIYFSRLSRTGTFVFAAPVPVPAPARDVPVIVDAANDATDPQLVWHADGYGLAWLQQPFAGGKRALMFTVLDEQGARLDLNFGVGAVNPAPTHQVSANGADVQDYALAWNGRTFRIIWTEKRDAGNKVYQMQTALAVPRKPGPPGYARAYEHPSAALVRATLFNGATNLRRTALPNQGNNPNDGYGWGRLNLRQSLAPLPPVTFYARDDAAVASGQTLRYRFRLSAGAQLLRATLAWTDPPGASLVNDLHLRITAPDGRIYIGNRWQAAPNAHLSDPLPNPPPVAPFESLHNAEQIVVMGAPTLTAGDYLVDVIGGAFAANAYQTHPGQAFALVFVGSGAEARFSGLPEPVDVPYY